MTPCLLVYQVSLAACGCEAGPNSGCRHAPGGGLGIEEEFIFMIDLVVHCIHLETYCMRSLDDLEFNELPIIARQGGVISVWGAWKRQLAAFHDPAMWEDVSAFERYFERLDGDAWGFAGYGIVVVDFDTRRVLSSNDWSTPSSLHPLIANHATLDEEDPKLAPLKALGRRPDQWSRVSLTILGHRAQDRKTVVLSEVLGPAVCERAAANPDEAERLFLAAMTEHRGTLQLGTAGACIVSNGSYLPEGWVQADDRGKEMPEWLIQQLEELRARGFPPSQWDDIDQRVKEADVPVEDDAIAKMAMEEGEDHELVRLARAYQTLKTEWRASAPVVRPKPV